MMSGRGLLENEVVDRPNLVLAVVPGRAPLGVVGVMMRVRGGMGMDEGRRCGLLIVDHRRDRVMRMGVRRG